MRQGNSLSPFLLIAIEGLNVINALVQDGLFTGYKVGESDNLFISCLQFVEDTLLVGVKSWANIRALKALLHLFEAWSQR
jgi:hypothetical protein